jgi:2-keto-3-deoxy-galactonokinase
MKDPLQSELPDADMQAAPRALLRAAQRARETARRTKTPLVIVRDGQLVEEYVADDEEAPTGHSPNAR